MRCAPHLRPWPSRHQQGARRGRRPIQNRGVVWRAAVGNIPLLTTLTHAQFAARIDRYHRPYYAALEQLLARRVERFGYAILLDAHSMPGTISRDLVLGTRGGSSCDPSLIKLATAALELRPGLFDVAIDDPYQGGEIVASFGRPDTNVHAVQLEINRSLYMDEYRLEIGSLPTRADVTERVSGGGWPQRAQSSDREARRRLGLVEALDALVRALGGEHAQLTALAAE